MCKYEIWVNKIYARGRQTHIHTQKDRQTDRQTNGHINTINEPGLGAGPSEKRHIIVQSTKPKYAFFVS